MCIDCIVFFSRHVDRPHGSQVYPPTGPPSYPNSLSIPGYTAATHDSAICAESSACDDECAYKLCNEGEGIGQSCQGTMGSRAKGQ